MPPLSTTETGQSGAPEGHDVLLAKDGVSLFYRWRVPAQPRGVMLIVHGVAEHSGRYQDMMQWASDQGFIVYAYDQRGHGRSGGRRVHVECFQQYADDLETMLNLVQGKHRGLPLIVFAHSMGTLVALTHARSYSQSYQGLILSSCAVQLSSKLSRWSMQVTARLHSLLPYLRVPNMIPPVYLTHDPEVQAKFKADAYIVNTVTVSWLNAFQAAQKRILAHIPTFSVPVLVMHSVSDHVAAVEGARQLVRHMPAERTRYYEFETLYHELHNEVPEDRQTVFDTISNWIQTIIIKPG